MIDLIPLENYGFIYFISIFLLSFGLGVLLLAVPKSNDRMYTAIVTATGFAFLLLCVVYIGFRPVSYVFSDMILYASRFEFYSKGVLDIDFEGNDVLFWLFLKLTSFTGISAVFFTLSALIYIFAHAYFARVVFRNQWFVALLMAMACFSFWGYAVNGIRNGLAVALFLIALSLKTRLKQLLFFVVAIAIHITMLLPVFAYLCAKRFSNTFVYLGIWLLCIPVSLLGAHFFQPVIDLITLGDSRVSYLTQEATMGKFSSSGFRVDFLLYSAIPIVVGIFYIYIKKIHSEEFKLLLNTYILSNAFWVLVISANYSNRFAYLSWFLFGFLVVFPFIKKTEYKVRRFGIIPYFLIMLNAILSIYLTS